MVMGIVTIASLVAALTYFAIEWPKYVATMGQNKFWGYQDGTTWGPAGWIAACIGAIVVFISLLCSCQRSSEEAQYGSYYSMGDHSESTMTRYPTQRNTAAGTPYV